MSEIRVTLTLTEAQATELYLFLNTAIMPWVRSTPTATMYQLKSLMDITTAIGEAAKAAKKGEKIE